MKRNIFVMMSGLVLTIAGLFVACSNDEDENVIQPIDVADSAITTFFNKELPERHNDSQPYEYSTSFFYDFSVGSKEKIVSSESFVRLINSNQELTDIYEGENELPEIDFDKYTLIIGHQAMPGLGFYLTKKELMVSNEALVLNLYTRNDREVIACAIQHLYFWGLYPKQSQKTVSVKCFMEYKYR